MTTYGGMTVAQWVAAVSALVSAVLAVIAGIDPGSILATKPTQTAVVAVFTASVPLLVGLFAVFTHHSAVVTTTVTKVTTPAPPTT